MDKHRLAGRLSYPLTYPLFALPAPRMRPNGVAILFVFLEVMRLYLGNREGVQKEKKNEDVSELQCMRGV